MLKISLSAKFKKPSIKEIKSGLKKISRREKRMHFVTQKEIYILKLHVCWRNRNGYKHASWMQDVWSRVVL